MKLIPTNLICAPAVVRSGVKAMHVVLLVLLALAPWCGQAQSRSFDCVDKSDLSAEQGQSVLLRLQSEYAKVEGLRAEFLQDSYLAALEVNELSSGKMLFKRPGKMRWAYEQPEPQVFLINGTEIRLYQERENQLLIDSAKSILLSDLPLSFLMGVGELSRDFSLLRACRTVDGEVLMLRPKSEDKGVRELRLLVDTSSSLPIGGYVDDGNGNITAILFKGMNGKALIREDELRIDAPPGTDVVDRRGNQ